MCANSFFILDAVSCDNFKSEPNSSVCVVRLETMSKSPFSTADARCSFLRIA